MAASIVGWAHTPFGKFDNLDLEALVGQATTAPSSRVRSLLGITRSGSISSLVPRPVQAGHAPCGLLKLKSCGEGG